MSCKRARTDAGGEVSGRLLTADRMRGARIERRDNRVGNGAVRGPDRLAGTAGAGVLRSTTTRGHYRMPASRLHGTVLAWRG